MNGRSHASSTTGVSTASASAPERSAASGPPPGGSSRTHRRPVASAPGAGAGFAREDWGKKFVAGEVKAINETKLTIARPDGQTQEIEVDENTSFRRGRESITLPDIKVGDFVRGRGEVKNAVFVPQELIVGGGQMRMMLGGPGGPGAAPNQNAPAKPDAEKPKDAPPKN